MAWYYGFKYQQANCSKVYNPCI